MRAYKVSKNSEITLEEKLKVLEDYDVEDLLYVLREFENYPNEYNKEVIIEVHNRLFEKGITCI